MSENIHDYKVEIKCGFNHALILFHSVFLTLHSVPTIYCLSIYSWYVFLSTGHSWKWLSLQCLVSVYLFITLSTTFDELFTSFGTQWDDTEHTHHYSKLRYFIPRHLHCSPFSLALPLCLSKHFSSINYFFALFTYRKSWTFDKVLMAAM